MATSAAAADLAARAAAPTPSRSRAVLAPYDKPADPTATRSTQVEVQGSGLGTVQRGYGPELSRLLLFLVSSAQNSNADEPIRASPTAVDRTLRSTLAGSDDAVERRLFRAQPRSDDRQQDEECHDGDSECQAGQPTRWLT